MSKFEINNTPFRSTTINIPPTKRNSFIRKHPLFSVIGAIGVVAATYCALPSKQVSQERIQVSETTEVQNARVRAYVLSNISSKLDTSLLCYDPYAGFHISPLRGVDMSSFTATSYPYHPHLKSAHLSIPIGQATFNISVQNAIFNQAGIKLRFLVSQENHRFLASNETIQTKLIRFCNARIVSPTSSTPPANLQLNPRFVPSLNVPLQTPSIPTTAECTRRRDEANVRVTEGCGQFGLPCHHLDYERVNQDYSECLRGVSSFDPAAEERRVNAINEVSRNHAIYFATTLNCFDFYYGFRTISSIGTAPQQNVFVDPRSYLANVTVQRGRTTYQFADPSRTRIAYLFEPEGLMVDYSVIDCNHSYSGNGYRVTIPYCLSR